MLKKLRKLGLPAVALATASLLAPTAAVAQRFHRDHERHEYWEHRHHFRGHVFVGPYGYGHGYPYGYSPYGYYDAWGFWHPY